MRILAVGDMVAEILYSERVREFSGNVDLILSCGDLPYPYLEYIVTMLRAPLLFVRGNHDKPIHTAGGRLVARPEGAIDIDGRVIRIKAVNGSTWMVGGLGGSMFYGGARNQYTEGQMRARIRRMKPRLWWNRLLHGRALDILVTHAPIKGIHEGKDRAHKGFRSYLRLVQRHRPRLFVHGHVHPTYGVDTSPRTIGLTRVVNVFGYEFLELDDA